MGNVKNVMGFCAILKILRDSEDSSGILKILARVYEDSGELPTPRNNLDCTGGNIIRKKEKKRRQKRKKIICYCVTRIVGKLYFAHFIHVEKNGRAPLFFYK